MASLRFLCFIFLYNVAILSVQASSAFLPPQMSPVRSVPQEFNYRSSLLAGILSNLQGFEELAMAVPALYSPVLSAWSGPITLFAPSDESIRSCISCSAPRLLREHIVPGLFSRVYLSKLSMGTKLETASPGKCLTITSVNTASEPNESNDLDRDSSGIKIFVDGIEITQPDLFNDGRIVIHGIQGFVAPLLPSSCAQESVSPEMGEPNRKSKAPIIDLMLRDAILRLNEGGYSILSLAMRVKYPELSGLNNMTLFALSDHEIFAGGHGYLSEVRFHVVPDKILMRSDLMNLKQGTLLPTLVRGQHLVVTQSGAGSSQSIVRINYIPIKKFDLVYNENIVVHSIFLPFPHLYLADDVASGNALDNAGGGIIDHGSSKNRAASAEGIESCGESTAVDTGECLLTPAAAPMTWSAVDIDEGV